MKSAKLLPKTVLFASSLAVLAFVACGGSDDTNDNPTPTPSAEGGAAGTGGSTAGSGGSTAGSGGSAAGSGGSTAGSGGGSGGSTAGSGGSTAGSGGSAGGAAGSGGSGAPPLDCKGANPSGCFTGTPSKPSDYLNCCTDAQCTKFDNTKLPLLVGGQLPPLPLDDRNGADAARCGVPPRTAPRPAPRGVRTKTA